MLESRTLTMLSMNFANYRKSSSVVCAVLSDYQPERVSVRLLFVCPAKLANPVAARQRPHPVHGEENPTRKGVSGERWGLKEAIGG